MVNDLYWNVHLSLDGLKIPVFNKIYVYMIRMDWWNVEDHGPLQILTFM
jgi:hypothetical protein